MNSMPPPPIPRRRQNPSPDSGNPATHQPPTPPIGSPTAIELAHKAAVRIACHMTLDKREEIQAYLEVEMCRTAIGALPIERKATEDSGGYSNHAYESRLSEEHGWETRLVLAWVCILKDLWLLLLLTTLADETKLLVQFEEYWWSRHLLELIFRILEGKGPVFRQDTQEEVTMAINQLLDRSTAKK